MGISIMQWRTAVGVQFYYKAPILRTQFVFDSFRFYHIFLFERIIFNDVFKYFKENNLLSPHQSGFIPGDSCVQQLIAITHEI